MASQPGGSDAVQLRTEVLSFRMVELQQVAERLGLKKTGRKSELQGRILAYFGELDPAGSAALGRTVVHVPQQQWKIQQATKVVHDVYRRMMGLPVSGSDQSALSTQQLAGVSSGTEAAIAAMARSMMGGGWGSQVTTAAGAATAASLHAQQHAQPPAAALYQQQQQYLQQQQAALSAMRGPGIGGGAARANKVRCICSVPIERGRMAMCQGKGCGVWQHCDCLGLQQGGQKHFLCELCRARLADPFWEATAEILPPAQLKPQAGRPPMLTAGGMQDVQCADRVFYLNQQQLEDVSRSPGSHRVQVGCLLAGDEVPQRYHWPKQVDLRINSMPQRPYFRAQNAKMGINQRDDVVDIGSMIVRGRNSLTLSAADEGTWIVTLQLARRRTLDQVKALMAPPESLSEAVARVRRQVGGGGGGGDSDDDLLVSHQVVSLKDPMSGQRMQTPARFAGASGLQAFDLDSFLSMAQRNRKWQDPTTMANSSVEQLQVDTYMQRVVDCLKASPSITDMEISAEGQWRPDGSSLKHFDISADPASVAAALASAAPPTTAPMRDTSAPGDTAEGEGAASRGRSGGSEGAAADELVVADSEEEEEDEAEELRKAAAAVKRTPPAVPAPLPGQKRKQPDTEVIDLLSSDDDEPPASTAPLQQAQPQRQQPMAGVAAQRQQQQQVSPAASGGPLRIRLPARPRPAEQQLPPSAHALQEQQQQQAWLATNMSQQQQRQQQRAAARPSGAAAMEALARAAAPLAFQPPPGTGLFVVPPGFMSASQLMDADGHVLPIVQPGGWAPAPPPAGPQAAMAAARAAQQQAASAAAAQAAQQQAATAARQQAQQQQAAAATQQQAQGQVARAAHNAEAFALFPWANDEEELASLFDSDDS